MIFRRLIAWFGFGRRQPLPPLPVMLEPATDGEAVFDLEEFGRLLISGKPEDLKKIACAMTR
jgi:hypothetical protein